VSEFNKSTFSENRKHAKVEAELRDQFWKRFNLVGFAGTGAAWIDLDAFERTGTVTTGGGGFRYELARRYKLHMGSTSRSAPTGRHPTRSSAARGSGRSEARSAIRK
jgi:hypothetical protein